MNKTFKIIFFIVLSIMIGYFVHFFYLFQKYSHSADWETYKQYLWLFKDSVKNEIDTNFSSSFVQKKDIYNNFHYKKDFNIVLWEFKDLYEVDLENAKINQDVNLEDIKFSSGDILNKGSDLEISIKDGFTFNHTMNLNMDSYSKIEKRIEGENYKGFYGTVNKMSLSDQTEGHQILLNYMDGLAPTLFLFYKGHHSFYIIIINRLETKPFDESIIDELNLLY
jgi:hypothetical protein